MNSASALLISLAKDCIPGTNQGLSPFGVTIQYCPFCGRKLATAYFVALPVVNPIPHGGNDEKA